MPCIIIFLLTYSFILTFSLAYVIGHTKKEKKTKEIETK